MLTLLLMSSQTASAQEGFNAWGFAPAAQDGDVRDPVTINRPGIVKRGEWYASGIVGFAKAPLYLVEVRDSGTTRAPALDNALGIDVTAGVSPLDRLRFDVAMPVFLTTSSATETAGPATGDLRLAAMVVPVSIGEEGGLGVRPWLVLPTGNAARFLGSSGVSGGASLDASVAPGAWTLTGEAGVVFNGAVESFNVRGSDAARFGASVGRLFGPSTGVTAEAHLQVPFSASDLQWREAPSEALLSVRHRLESGAHLVGGVGSSLTPGIGSAEWRLFVGGGYGILKRAPPDGDLDGIADANDACPEVPETFNGYKDEDGCPDELASVVATVTRDGKALDGAVDVTARSGEKARAFQTSVAAMADRIPGEVWTFDAKVGCLAGSNWISLAEGLNELEVPISGSQAPVTFLVVDLEDAPIANVTFQFTEQPAECGVEETERLLEDGTLDIDLWTGVHQVAATAEGFETRVANVEVADAPQTVKIQLSPSRAAIEDQEIKILDRVLFQTATSSIKPISFQLLDQVAAILISHKELEIVEVQGHADERGTSQYNLELSTDRAKSVKTYLVDAGVDPARLTIRGYGEDQPLKEGSDESAWKENRRVQFLIRETTDDKE